MWLYIILYIVGGLITTKFIVSTFPSWYFEKDDMSDCVAIAVLFLIWPLFITIIYPLYLIGRILIEMFKR